MRLPSMHVEALPTSSDRLMLPVANWGPCDCRFPLMVTEPVPGVAGAGVWPVPESAVVCGLSGALSVMLKFPFREPFAVGVKVTEIVQLALGGRLAGQLLVWAKSPLTLMFAITTEPLLVLVSVTDWVALVVLMFWAGKVIPPGDRLSEMLLTTLSPTVPVCDRLPLVAVTVRSELPAGVALVVFTVKIELAIEFVDGRLSVAGLKLAEAPCGKPLTLNDTFPVNPNSERVPIPNVAVPPGPTF